MRQMTLDQVGLDDFGDGSDSTDEWPPFDEYGPTMDRPIPEPDRSIPAWVARMRDRGYCPSCLREAAYCGGWDYAPPIARADLRRPERIEREFDRHGDVLAEQPDS